MIQRIQSIYLFLAAALGVSLFCFPFAEIVTGGNNVALTVCHLSPAVDGVSAAAMTPLALVTSLFVVLCLIALFKFRNRAMQMKITKLCGYLQILIFVAMIAFIIGLSKTPGSDKLTIEASFCLPAEMSEQCGEERTGCLEGEAETKSKGAGHEPFRRCRCGALGVKANL